MITPPVGGAYRFDAIRNVIRLTLFALATICSAGVLGALTGYLGAFLPHHGSISTVLLWLTLTIAATAYGIAEIFKAGWHVPSRSWLIPRSWGSYGSPAFDILFGLFLGPGFFTIIPFIGFHVLLAVCLLSGDLLQGALLMGIFGVTRTLPILLIPIILTLKKKPYNFGSVYEAHKWFIWSNHKLRFVRITVLFAVSGTTLAIGIDHAPEFRTLASIAQRHYSTRTR